MRSLKRRKLLEAIGALFGAAMLPSCGGDHHHDDEPPAADNIQWAIYPDVADNRVMNGTLPSGERFILSGEKSAEGKIISAHELLLIDENDELTIIDFEETANRLTAIGPGFGVSLTRPVIGGWGYRLVVGDRQLELNIPEVLQPVAQAHSTRAGEAGALTWGPCAGCSTTGNAQAGPALAAPLVEIEVAGCTIDDARVWVQLRDQAGKLFDSAVAKKIGPRRFAAVIAHPNTPDEAILDASMQVKALLEEYDITEGAFTSIVKSLLKTGLDGLLKGVVAVLEAANRRAETYAELAPYINASPEDITDVQKMAKVQVFIGKTLGLILKSVEVYQFLQRMLQGKATFDSVVNAYDQMVNNQLQLQAVVKTPDGQKYAGVASGLIAPEGPYPTLSVSVAGGMQLSAISITPAYPRARETYVAAGSAACLLTGDTATISVVGTDGYTHSQTTIISGSGTQSFSLTVPGGDSGVHDVITLEISRNGTVLAVRKASLVFT